MAEVEKQEDSDFKEDDRLLRETTGICLLINLIKEILPFHS
jgi:hypothetical protein